MGIDLGDIEKESGRRQKAHQLRAERDAEKKRVDLVRKKQAQQELRAATERSAPIWHAYLAYFSIGSFFFALYYLGLRPGERASLLMDLTIYASCVTLAAAKLRR